MPRRSRKQLEESIRDYKADLEYSLNETPLIFDGDSNKKLYAFEKALITSTKALKGHLNFL